MSETPVPNRSVEMPKSLTDMLENAWTCLAYNPTVELDRLKKVVGIAYRYGYVDGYRDGHTDAENGHDERVWAHVN